MFAAPSIVTTEVFARIPENRYSRGRRRGILEGPSFDREGNLWVTNVTMGQIWRVSPAGEVTLVTEYDGEPNGLKIHRDGRIFIADHKLGLLLLDPASGQVSTVLDRPKHERFKGLNDLVFTSAGDLAFTDQGESGLHDPTGRVWLQRADGTLLLLLDNVPSPNGVVPAKDERILYLAVTRGNAVWRVPVRRDGTVGRVGIFIQLSGGVGPDGMALDEQGGLAVAHAGMGSVWLFDEKGRPTAELRSCAGDMTTNVAFGGPDRRTLFITEAVSGSILTARVEVPGREMYSHM